MMVRMMIPIFAAAYYSLVALTGTVDQSLVGVGARVTVDAIIEGPCEPERMQIRLTRRSYDEWRDVTPSMTAPGAWSATARFNVPRHGFYRMRVYVSGQRIGCPGFVKVRKSDIDGGELPQP